MKSVEELCQYYVAFLRSVSLLHQNNHWQTRGENSYGNHLLFERIYKSSQEDVDLMAEKFIGVFGNDCLNLAAQSQIIAHLLEKYSSDKDLVVSSLNAEKDFIEFAEGFYKTLKAEDKLSLGTDDAIMAVNSNRESAVYLLKQAASDQALTSGNGVLDTVAARSSIFKRLIKTNKG